MTEPAVDANQGGENTGADRSRGIDRRVVLLAGLGVLAGCAAPRSRGNLPTALWPTTKGLAAGGTIVPAPTPVPGVISGTISRASWARGAPIVSRVNLMLTPREITIHHDGMPPFTATEFAAVSARIDLIRRAHLGRDGGSRWGDIGYHFVVDRAGRAWDARPLTYQGAHVKDHNEGNIGILCLGNYEQQVPTQAQVRKLEQLIVILRGRYRIPQASVYTHRELCNNCTLCPGRNLQRAIASSRSARRFG